MSNAPLTRLIISALVFLLALGAYAYWFHLLDAANARVSELGSEIVAQNAAQISSEQAAAELSDLRGAENEIEGYFVATDNVVGFLEALQSLGTSLGSQVSVVSVTAGATPRPHIDLALTASGSFAAVMRTLGAIEYSSSDITVNTLNLSTTNTDAASAWTASMTLTIGTASSSPRSAAPPSPSPVSTSTATTSP